MQLRRLAATAAVALAAATSLAAVRRARRSPTHGETEGIYVDTGDLKYQVQISRQLNPADFEDRDYLTGLPAADRTLPAGQEWFARLHPRLEHDQATRIRRPRSSRSRDTTGQGLQADRDRHQISTARLPRGRGRRRRPDPRSGLAGPREPDPGRPDPLQGAQHGATPTARSSCNITPARRRPTGPPSTSTSRRAALPSVFSPRQRAPGAATGAAVSPPAPCADEQHADRDARPLPAGAKAANQASVSVVSSAPGLGGADPPTAGCRAPACRSASPQLGRAGLARDLDAGDRGGRRRCRRGRRRRISCSTVRATVGARGRARRRGRPAPVVAASASGRRPRRPIVAATSAICSGVASTWPWPIADEPTARSSPISRGRRGSCSSPRRRSRVGCVEAEALGGRDEPLRAELGARAARRPSCTSARRTTASEPPQDSPLAFWSSTPSSVAVGLVRERVGRAWRRRPRSTPVERDDLERRAGRLQAARARSRRARASRRSRAGSPTIAAEAPGERRRPRRCWTLGVDRRAHRRGPARRALRRARRPPARSVAAGRAGQALVERRAPGRSRPTCASVGDAALRRQRAARSAGIGPERADDRPRGGAERRRCGPGPGPAACRRGPGASARGGQLRASRRSCSPARRPGKTSRGVQSMRAASPSLPPIGSATVPRIVAEDARVAATTGDAERAVAGLARAAGRQRGDRRRARPRRR